MNHIYSIKQQFLIHILLVILHSEYNISDQICVPFKYAILLVMAFAEREFLTFRPVISPNVEIRIPLHKLDITLMSGRCRRNFAALNGLSVCSTKLNLKWEYNYRMES